MFSCFFTMTVNHKKRTIWYLLRRVNSTEKKSTWTVVFIQYIYFCTNVLHVQWNLACPITVHFTFLMLPQNTYKITSMKKMILSGFPVALVLVQAKDFHQHHIWCFPLPCTGKHLLECHTSSAMISCDVLTCNIHAIQQRHLILCSMIYMYMLQNLIGYSKCLNGWFKLYCN